MKPLTDSMDFDVEEDTFCWIVTGKKTLQGYKAICRLVDRQPVTFYAHRVAYEIANGPLEPGAQVAHTCDNPSCINPEHLFAADSRSNTIDKLRKNRGAAYLTKEQATEIILRPHWAHGDMTKLAHQYGVPLTVVARVLSAKSWVWLKQDLGMDIPWIEPTAAERRAAADYGKKQYRLKHGPRKETAVLTLYNKKIRAGKFDQVTPEERAAASQATKEGRQREIQRHIDNGTIDQYRKKASIRSMEHYRVVMGDPITKRRHLDQIAAYKAEREAKDPSLKEHRLQINRDYYNKQRLDPVTGAEFMAKRRQQQNEARARKKAKEQQDEQP